MTLNIKLLAYGAGYVWGLNTWLFLAENIIGPNGSQLYYIRSHLIMLNTQNKNHNVIVSSFLMYD